MKTILLFISALCLSCTTRPTATFIDPVSGATVSLNLGGTIMSRTDGVIASIKHNGTEMKYSSITEDSSEVPKHLITTAGLVAGGVIANRGEAIRQTNETARHATDSKTTLGLDKGVTERANFVPTVTPPAELAR